nr:9002_t:CDS:2 [Entrophospora candida]
MPEYLRRHAFRNIADVEFEFDDEIGFNSIFFYNTFDRGGFTGHENEWVTVHNQKVVEYGKEYSDDQLNYVLETMPDAIQLPVDQERLPRSKPAKMDTWEEGVEYNPKDYGAPAGQWFQAKILLWEYDSGNKVKYALVGNDVTDKLAYVHEPGNPLKFLDIGDETRLTTFLLTSS